jgi:hypothetical protein
LDRTTYIFHVRDDSLALCPVSHSLALALADMHLRQEASTQLKMLQGAWKFFLPGQFKRIAKELEGRVYDMIFRAK